MRLHSSILIFAILAISCGSVTDNSTIHKEHLPPYGSPIKAGRHFDYEYDQLAEEYNELHSRRVKAYAEHDLSVRHKAIEQSDIACYEFERNLRLTDSAWRATAMWYLDCEDGSFTELCAARGLDSAYVVSAL